MRPRMLSGQRRASNPQCGVGMALSEQRWLCRRVLIAEHAKPGSLQNQAQQYIERGVDQLSHGRGAGSGT